LGKIQEEMRENVISMNNIMEELQMIGLGKTPKGYSKYFNFKSNAKKLITKIDLIIANQSVNISGKVEPLTEQSVLREEFCENLNAQSSKSKNSR
jgi:hypothetical protein